MTSLLDSLLNPSDSGPQAKTKQRDAYRPKPRRAKVGQRAATATRALERNARAVEAAGGQPDGLPTSQTETTEYAWELLRPLSDCSGAINALLKAAGFNVSKVLPAVSVAMDFAAGRADWFTAPDKLLGMRLTADRDAAEKRLMKKWGQEWRKLKSEQERTGVVLVERQPGGYDEQHRKKPSSMRVPLLPLVARTLELAEAMQGFKGKSRGECLEKAAGEVISGVRAQTGSEKLPDRLRRPRRDDASMNTREIRTIRTLAERVRARAANNGGSPEVLKEQLRLLMVQALE